MNRNITNIINDINAVVIEIKRIRIKLSKLVDEYVDAKLEKSNEQVRAYQ